MPDIWDSGDETIKSNDISLSADDKRLERWLSIASSSDLKEIATAQKALRKATLDSGLRFEVDRPWPISLRPTILEASWVNRLKQMGKRFVQVFDNVLELYRTEPEVRRHFATYEPVRDLILRAPTFRPLTRICRFV